MFKPINDLMIVEVIKEFEGIVMPDNKAPDTGNTFRVKAIGPGYRTETGQLIAPSVDVGDRVALVGKVLKIPEKGNDLLVARASDVMLVERPESGDMESCGGTEESKKFLDCPKGSSGV